MLNKYFVSFPLFRWKGLIGLSPSPLMERVTPTNVINKNTFIKEEDDKFEDSGFINIINYRQYAD
jgi:hypothetical protein